MSFLLLLMSSLQQNWRKGQNRFFPWQCGGLEGGGTRWGEGGEMAQTMYAYVNNK
jgi:hypothetical protein